MKMIPQQGVLLGRHRIQTPRPSPHPVQKTWVCSVPSKIVHLPMILEPRVGLGWVARSTPDTASGLDPPNLGCPHQKGDFHRKQPLLELECQGVVRFPPGSLQERFVVLIAELSLQPPGKALTLNSQLSAWSVHLSCSVGWTTAPPSPLGSQSQRQEK